MTQEKKPRIKRAENGDWVCYANVYAGYGATPRQAWERFMELKYMHEAMFSSGSGYRP